MKTAALLLSFAVLFMSIVLVIWLQPKLASFWIPLCCLVEGAVLHVFTKEKG